MSPTPATIRPDAVARGRLVSVEDGRLELAVEGTDSRYRLHFVPGVPAETLRDRVGSRVRGVIAADALRVHPARGGGRFIEPLVGEPRIVAGTVQAVETEAARLLVDVAVPMWVTLPWGQDAAPFAPGVFVSFYVESGATFTPVDPRDAR